MKNLAMAVVIRNGRVLVQKRWRHNQGMVFEFPGGAVDAGENGAQAAARELREETGLTAGVLVACHQAMNQFGGKIHYAVFSLPEGEEPKAEDPERRQSFYWFEHSDVPLGDFWSADVEFISCHLPQHLREPGTFS